MSVCVRGCPLAHIGRPRVSISAHRTSVAVRVCLCVSVSTHRTSVAVHRYTYQHVGPWAQHADPSRGLFGTSVGVRQQTQDVRGCPSAHTGRLTHISTLVLGLNPLALPVDCSDDFGQRGLSVQYTQDVCGCPSAHIGCSCVSVSTHRMSVAVRVCLFVSSSTHRTSVDYTQDVRGCPSAHTGHPWLSVVCLCMSVSTHMTSVAVHQYTYQHAAPWTQHAGPSRGMFGTSVGVRQHTQDVLGLSTLTLLVDCSDISMLVFGLSTLAHLVDCSGDFGLRGLSVQYIQDVRSCQCLFVSTHRTSVAVHQYTYRHLSPWTQHADPSHGLFVSTHSTSVGVCQHTQDIRGCPTHRTSVGVRQHTQDVRGCPCVFVCVRHHTHDIRGCPSVYISARWSLDSARCPFSWTVRHTQDVRGCPSVDISARSTHRTSVAVRVCPSAHTGLPWLSISTHISTLVLGLSMLVLGLSTLALPVDCSGDFGQRGLSVQYTHDVRGYLLEHTGRPWLSVCVRVCLCVSVSTHRTSVAVHQYTYQHAGPWTQHTVPSRGLFG
ncbi:hypothetical protein YC2023_066209 [Brassica napus]